MITTNIIYCYYYERIRLVLHKQYFIASKLPRSDLLLTAYLLREQ